FSVQPFLHFHLHRHLLGQAKGSRILPLIGLALLPMSIYGGYFGVGFGFVILAFLGFTKMHDIHQINALKNIVTLFIALTSIFVLFRTGLIGWEYGLSMAAGCAIGGYYGSRLAQRFSSHAIRIVVIIIGFAAVTYLAFRTYQT
ncbi:MAG TPA: sulfite exporter TauE/SafE family protein, partial [Candidatus Saccharimonadales bacterium]